MCACARANRLRPVFEYCCSYKRFRVCVYITPFLIYSTMVVQDKNKGPDWERSCSWARLSLVLSVILCHLIFKYYSKKRQWLKEQRTDQVSGSRTKGTVDWRYHKETERHRSLTKRKIMAGDGKREIRRWIKSWKIRVCEWKHKADETKVLSSPHSH